MIGPPYIRDDRTRVWERKGYAPLDYSDGAATEARLLETVRACRDLSVLSAELRARIVDWPSEYHFSAARANIVRALDFRANQAVLELGSGCGAITRALGETGAAVMAVEGSRQRAAVTAARCADLPNVAVACDSIAGVAPGRAFDCVTLIGVLEYAPLYFPGADPVGQCLAVAARHLKPDGRLIVAIENRLGLKYFAGCSEDHLGEEYYGIENRYETRTPVTFGRRELQERLKHACLVEAEWMFPFPDYKLAGVVIHQDAFAAPGLNVADLLCRAQSRDYRGSPLRAFDETLAWPTIVANGLGPDLANSFIVVARPPTATTLPARRKWYARSYATTRRAAYATATEIRAAPGGTVVERQPLAPGTLAPPEHRVRHSRQRESYAEGKLLFTKVAHAIGRRIDLDLIAEASRPWVDYLIAQATGGGSDPLAATLPGLYVDCTPFNLIVTPEGLQYIDQEWEWNGPIPVGWVVVRGLAHAAHRWVLSEEHRELTLGAFVVQVGRRLGLEISPRHLAEATQLEDRLLQEVFGEASGAFEEILGRPIDRHVPAFAVAARALQYAQELALARQEVERIKGTVSWRITKPLRFAWNLVTGRLARRHRR
ncbi:MAG TPA: class I SAM-dependent methyltransferase [Verrucomicrobiae bacterium]|nr:class I SAM-dependent methyltransferase [Verrucomicrobiae bacterium]